MGEKRDKNEGKVRKRRDGRWEARYVPPDGGPPKSAYGKTKGEAKRKRKQALEDLERGLVPDADRLTVGAYLDLWLSEYVEGTVWPTTFENYASIVKNHLKPALGRKKLKALSREDVLRLYRQKRREGYAPGTVRHVHVALNKALSQAHDLGYVARNVASGAGAKGLEPIRQEETTTLTVEEVGAFFRAARESNDRFEALYVLAVTTGLRQGELLALKWGDADLASGVLRVRRGLSVVKGEGPVLKETKTGKGRPVQMLPMAIDALVAHGARQLDERVRYRGVWEERGLVFPSAKGTPMHRQNLHRRSFKPLLERAGLPDGVRFYDLRHTFATLMFELDAKPKVVQEMLGHSSIGTTMNTYTHLIPNMQKEAVDKLQERLIEGVEEDEEDAVEGYEEDGE